MVLEMKVPEGASWEALKSIFPKFISYILSFIYIGLYWNNHHHLFQIEEKVNGKVLWANLTLLFSLSLIPFTTAWVGENHFGKYPVVLYGLNLLFCALVYAVLEKHAIKNEGADSKLKRALENNQKEILSCMIYLVGIIAAFFIPLLGLFCFVLVAILWFISDPRIEKTLN